ncbi:MAG: YifB family Mg chelatase-like AAA ATPase [Pseudomonadota bacterium]
MLAQVYAAAFSGINAVPVKVEVDVQMQGLPGWNMVGLLETAVKEAKDRVGSAVRNSGFSLPNRKTLINLSPADLKKSGAHYDLPIAVALLTAVGACRPSTSARYLIAGELALTGKVLPVCGVLMMALAAKSNGIDGMIVPRANAWEAKLAGIDIVVPVESLAQAVAHLNDGITPELPKERIAERSADLQQDYGEVKGQPFAKRGMEIAAAGGHNIALKGPPGTGKTMLAERLPSILPPLTREEALDVLKIQSLHGMLRDSASLPTERPFRAPHHSASYAGLIGGGHGTPRLGEISLAHHGVLFLDELAEFKKDVLEVLRQPLESGEVNIVRAGMSVKYPARFLLASAFNLCRCGFWSHPTRACTCSIAQIRHYRSKLSGPLLDRIDLHVEVGPPPHEALLESFMEEKSEAMRARVLAARDRQTARNAKSVCNAILPTREIHRHCAMGRDERSFLAQASKHHQLSARAVHRVIKVARTIADLADSEKIQAEHIAEAMNFRPTLEDLG